MTDFVRKHAPDKLAGKPAWQLYDLQPHRPAAIFTSAARARPT